jgi:hypothetical protein
LGNGNFGGIGFLAKKGVGGKIARPFKGHTVLGNILSKSGESVIFP